MKTMTKTQDFLVEIGTEELPPTLLLKLSNAFGQGIANGLKKAGLEFNETKVYASPRRLAVIVTQLVCEQKDQDIERKGPNIKAAYDKNGKPTRACLGFAESCGTTVDKLKTEKTEKGEWLIFKKRQKGEMTKNLLPNIVNHALKKLPLSKSMRWGEHNTEFIRPAHWVVMLYGDKPINTIILGLKSGRETWGHRFLYNKPIVLKSASDYEKKLASPGKVIASFEERKENIRKQVVSLARKKGNAIIDEPLLNEVTSLVEWPVALLGSFSKQFLDVPPEALITAMKTHQKCFPLIDKNKKLLPNFVAISNIESKNPKRVIAGNERVILARLSDAEFFYHTDLKHSLESRIEKLKTVIFQKKLGSLFDKATRISNLSEKIAKQINANHTAATRAGLLAKSDLLSEMVGEFPELQGIMGYYYALKDNEPKAVALAIKHQYKPKFSGDTLPDSDTACAVALADRMDTLVGIFGINQPPTGEKDPFALRRAALGVLRIIIEKKFNLDLKDLISNSIKAYKAPLQNSDVSEQLLHFIMERLRALYQEQGIDAHVFAAVHARYPTQPLDFHQRIDAVQQFQKLPEAKALAAANKRVSNILKKQDGISIHNKVNPTLLEKDTEQVLASLLEKKSKEVEDLYKKAEYTKALTTLATLQAPVDAFFDDVLVMTEDEKLRHNRLALLTNLRTLFLHVADISLLSS